MQTLQFTRGLQQIVYKLKAKEIVTFLTPYLKGGPQPTPIQEGAKDNFSTLVIQASNGFAELASDPETKRILDTLKVADVYAAPRMGKLISTFGAAPTSQHIWGVPDNFQLFYSFVAMLTWLDQLSSSCTSLLETERVNRALPGTATVELEIIDDGTTGVDAERVRRFFTSLIELHSQLARFLKVEGAHLEIVYMDSGSILVGFATAVGIAATLQKLLREIWNEVKYGPFERLDRKMDSLGKVLTVTKEIQQQIQDKVLSEEDGKNLKHRILSEAFALIEVGAMLPAENAVDEKEQRKLLTERRQRLLGSGDGPPVDDSANKG
jgi:hypothetical protein